MDMHPAFFAVLEYLFYLGGQTDDTARKMVTRSEKL
jgi:hypothetical protein